MATTQNDNRAKFLELRKQGISVADARNQTYGPAPVVADATPSDTTPVVPTAPVVAPINTSPESATKSTNIAQREANIASRQATPVVTPTPTVAPPTPVEATVTPAPTTPTQTPFQQAQAESEKIKAQNEAQMKLNTQQADLKAQERQQVAQETAKANTPVNQKDVLNALVSGVSVAPQNTAAYRNAQMQYKTYQKFATMTPTQLVDNMKMGEIGTETAQLLASNPNYIKAKEDFDKFQKNQSINNMIKSVAEGATGKTTAVDHYQNASDSIAKKLGINETNADAFARIVSKDPETLQLTKTVSNIAKQLNTLNTERNAVYEDLKKQYPDLSASAIMTLMAGRTKEATAQIDALNSSLTLTQADLKMAMEMAKAEYDATKEDIALQAGLAKEDRAMQNALDLSQAQFDQKLAQQAQLTNDPTTAITTMIDEYKKLGIPFTRSTQQVISDFETSGKDLPTYLSELQGQIQSKPEYKKIQALQQGQMSDAQKVAASQNFDIKKMGLEQDFQMKLAKAKETTNNKWTKLDDGMYTNESGDIITAEELKTAKLTNNSYINKPVGAEGGDCGFYASRGTGMTATPGGNSKEARTKAFSETMPQVGGMAFFGGAGYDPTYGHIAIVTGVNADGTITVKDSNYRGDGKVTERTVKADTVSGYYNNTPLAKGVNTQQQPTGQYSESDIELFSEIAAMDGSVQNTALKNSNLTRQQLAEYTSLAKSGKIPPTESQKQAALGTMSNIQGIAELDWTDAVGKFDYSRILGLQDSENARALIDNIRNSSALNNLGMLKGPMSDKDVEFIKSVSSKLDPVQSNAQFEKNIVEMYNIAARKVGADEIKNLSEIPKERILPGQQTNTTNTGGGQTQTYQGYTITGL